MTSSGKAGKERLEGRSKGTGVAHSEGSHSLRTHQVTRKHGASGHHRSVIGDLCSEVLVYRREGGKVITAHHSGQR